MSDGEDIRPGDLPEVPPPEEEIESGPVAEQKRGTNEYFRRMMDRNFIDYANYVIGSRAIPDVDDGLKPVQRRILWSLFLVYDGRTQKVARIVGNTMHFHPHGDASIGEALVVLANKGGCIEEQVLDRKTGKTHTEYISTPYYIKKQGNFGNILTGSPAAAGRYTECGLTKLAYETLFNRDITHFVSNYDGTELEPTVLPAKVPSLLMLGNEGIAVGMSTLILPHNFNELIDAEIAELRGESFQLFPDFQQGGVMDVSEYADGNGRIVLRAKIDIEGRDLVIREIPCTCTTESLVASIEKAAEKNKIRISNVSDFTTDHVEIRVTPTRGYDPEKTLNGLFMYTDCSVSISPKMMVICDRRPVQMTVTEVLRRNVEKLRFYLRSELELELERQKELRHAKTLAQLFFENRIYKRIEECKTQEEEYREVIDGLAPFRDQLTRDITTEDVDKLLALPVRRIARFDIEKNQQELREIADRIKQIKHDLAHLVDYAIKYLSEIKEKYGKSFPRRTEIEHLEQIDRSQAALNNIKIGWDRKNGYIGRAVKSDDTVVCNEFDRFLCVEKSGKYKVIPLPPDKLFVGRLYDFRRYDAQTVFGIVYREKKSGKYYGKRSSVGGFILEKEYNFFPAGCVLELFTPRADAIYEMQETDGRGKTSTTELNLMELPLRSAKARGLLITTKSVTKLTHSRYLTPEELEQYREQADDAEENGDNDDAENAAEEPPTAEEPPVAVPPPVVAEPPVEEASASEEPEASADEEKPAVKTKRAAKKKAATVEEPSEAKEPPSVASEEPPQADEQPEEPEAPADEEKPAAKTKRPAKKKAAAVDEPPEAEEPPTAVEEPPQAEEPPPAVEEPPQAEEPPPAVGEPPQAEKPVDGGSDELIEVAPDQDGDSRKSRQHRNKPDAPAAGAGKDSSAEDELGIVQPEFGF